MKTLQHSLARQAMSERSAGASGVGPRTSSDTTLSRRVLELLSTTYTNVLVTGASGERFDQWALLTASTLRFHPGIELKSYLPTSAESLVERFNTATRPLSLSDARSEEPLAGSLLVVLVPDVRALLQPEAQLLLRLVNDFPAAGMRLLILADTGADDAIRMVRGVFAHRLQCLAYEWPRPHPQLLERRNVLLPGASLNAGISAVDAPRAPAGATTRFSLIDEAVVVDSVNSDTAPQSRVRRMITWGSTLLALILISALVVVLLHRDRTPGGGGRTLSQSNSSLTSSAAAGSAYGARRE